MIWSKQGLLALLLAGFMPISPAYGDELIGRWRDKIVTFYDVTIEIWKSDGESYYQLLYPNTGTTGQTRFELVKDETINSNFLVVDSPIGENLRIRQDGNLNIFDHGLLVRVAEKIE